MKYTGIWKWIIVLVLLSGSGVAAEHLRMSTTTSTENSGLLAVLNPAFEKKYHAKVDVIAVGTGKALRIGSHGDVDIVFVHAPAAERVYVKKGDFIDRKAVMHNDFIVLGPASDPAGIRFADSAVAAFKTIASHRAPFISRGDDSGTDKKEKALWKVARIHPSGTWYMEAGQGMGAVLTMASEKRAYTLSDRGTFIALSDKLALQVLFEGDKQLFNPYHIMAVNPKKHSGVNYDLARKYIDFVTGEEGQAIIAAYRKRGQQLFYPDVIR